MEANRTQVRGRASGGILIGIPKNLQWRDFSGNEVNNWASVQVKIEEEWWQIVVAYNRTVIMPFKDELELKFEEGRNEHRIKGGDPNARIGKEGAREVSKPRTTKDEETNDEGIVWIELFERNGLGVLNGNTPGDLNGEYTSKPKCDRLCGSEWKSGLEDKTIYNREQDRFRSLSAGDTNWRR